MVLLIDMVMLLLSGCIPSSAFSLISKKFIVLMPKVFSLFDGCLNGIRYSYGDFWFSRVVLLSVRVPGTSHVAVSNPSCYCLCSLCQYSLFEEVSCSYIKVFPLISLVGG